MNEFKSRFFYLFIFYLVSTSAFGQHWVKTKSGEEIYTFEPISSFPVGTVCLHEHHCDVTWSEARESKKEALKELKDIKDEDAKNETRKVINDEHEAIKKELAEELEEELQEVVFDQIVNERTGILVRFANFMEVIGDKNLTERRRKAVRKRFKQVFQPTPLAREGIKFQGSYVDKNFEEQTTSSLGIFVDQLITARERADLTEVCIIYPTDIESIQFTKSSEPSSKFYTINNKPLIGYERDTSSVVRKYDTYTGVVYMREFSSFHIEGYTKTVTIERKIHLKIKYLPNSTDSGPTWKVYIYKLENLKTLPKVTKVEKKLMESLTRRAKSECLESEKIFEDGKVDELKEWCCELDSPIVWCCNSLDSIATEMENNKCELLVVNRYKNVKLYLYAIPGGGWTHFPTQDDESSLKYVRKTLVTFSSTAGFLTASGVFLGKYNKEYNLHKSASTYETRDYYYNRANTYHKYFRILGTIGLGIWIGNDIAIAAQNRKYKNNWRKSFENDCDPSDFPDYLLPDDFLLHTFAPSVEFTPNGTVITGVTYKLTF